MLDYHTNKKRILKRIFFILMIASEYRAETILVQNRFPFTNERFIFLKPPVTQLNLLLLISPANGLN